MTTQQEISVSPEQRKFRIQEYFHKFLRDNMSDEYNITYPEQITDCVYFAFVGKIMMFHQSTNQKVRFGVKVVQLDKNNEFRIFIDLSTGGMCRVGVNRLAKFDNLNNFTIRFDETFKEALEKVIHKHKCYVEMSKNEAQERIQRENKEKELLMKESKSKSKKTKGNVVITPVYDTDWSFLDSYYPKIIK